MASVIKQVRPGVTRRVTVKNLGWFFRKAATTTIDKFDLWQSNNGWEMFVNFANGDVFQTHYADLSVFKEIMNRRRSLRGVTVVLYRNDGSKETLRLGS